MDYKLLTDKCSSSATQVKKGNRLRNLLSFSTATPVTLQAVASAPAQCFQGKFLFFRECCMQRHVPSASASNDASVSENPAATYSGQPLAQPSGVSRVGRAETAQSGSMTERWLAENDEALRSSNDFVERHGLPLARYRRFWRPPHSVVLSAAQRHCSLQR